MIDTDLLQANLEGILQVLENAYSVILAASFASVCGGHYLVPNRERARW